MKTKLLKELPLILLVIAPLVYLLSIWPSLPSEVPMHYDLHGNVDRYGSKNELLIFSFGLPAFIYFLFLIIPAIDPKGKIKTMGNKFYKLKLIMVFFISAISIYIIYEADKGADSNAEGIFIIIGFLLCFLGNYFQSLKPNYFIGIRTPWTLENETVWKETHKIAGKIWMVGGLFIIILSLVLSPEIFSIILLIVIGIMVIIPVIYSFVLFKKLKNTLNKP